MTTDTASRDQALWDEASRLDAQDPLATLRSRFFFPRSADGDALTYLCGNSLGLAPIAAEAVLDGAFEDWKMRAVEGHFEGDRPWLGYHEPLARGLAELVGAGVDEVVATGTLTANLHTLLASFYRPSGDRDRIRIEADAFPSDRYAAATQIELHFPGEDHESRLIVATPAAPGQRATQHLLAEIERQGEALAVVFVGGVHYLTGEALDIERITAAAHSVGARCVVDLAHAIGNIPLQLHAWGVDAAAWCSYKYLNCGPGAIAGLFVHERNFDAFRLGGWWGNDPSIRFEMPEAFAPQRGAAGWQLSNAPVFSMAPLYASLPLFGETTAEQRAAKRASLWSTSIKAIEHFVGGRFQLLTPQAAGAHGAQLSLAFQCSSAVLARHLRDAGVVCDERPPNVLRVAPTVLYNSHRDVVVFASALRDALDATMEST